LCVSFDLGGGDAGLTAPATTDGALLGDLIRGGEADEAVDEPADGVGLAELEADNRGHEIELGDCHEPPVEASDHDERRGDDVELLHCIPPSVVMYRVRIGTVQLLRGAVKYLSKFCTIDLVSAHPRLRIGELSRRLGVSAELLRAWERRYGLLEPERSDGGFRLYGDADEERVRLMQAHLANGVSAAQAARLALAGERPRDVADQPAAASGEAAHEAIDALRRALESYDEVTAHAVIDSLLASFTLDTVVRDVLMPYLHDLGDRWESGAVSVAQEHYASSILRGRLLGLARGWGQGRGPRAVLACAPAEQHDLALITFGLALRSRGWRITFLGQDTPVAELIRTAESLRPELVVVTATTTRRLIAAADGLEELQHIAPLAIAGPGAKATVARRVGARVLEGDPVSAADALVPA
jgi:DNA-binding transcriptional MerR regulator